MKRMISLSGVLVVFLLIMITSAHLELKVTSDALISSPQRIIPSMAVRGGEFFAIGMVLYNRYKPSFNLHEVIYYW